ncbi:PREDICTED: fasciclin-2-like, partial [Priapulus caudatus]|uniref:Fasciclin-2-like n=1 Tax=Priapulus caudatus TaxID=37621 RepID=A0ABM1EE38_PRICU
MCTWMYAVWLVILLTAPSIDGQATELVIQPPTLVAKFMLEATAFCRPEGNPEPQDLEWWGPYEREKGKITDDISKRVHVKLAQNNKDLQLYIREVWPEDQGEYTCEARANGQPIVRPLTVTVYQDITIVDAPPLQNPVIYTNALIKCKVEGNPKPEVQWIRGGTETINAGGRYTYEPDGLRIENILETDNDLYICRAYVAETGAARSIDITVEVHIPPEINIPPAASFGVEGFDATMSCYSLGKPTPEYEWLKGNQPLNNPIKYPQSGNELRVTKLTKIPDESTYSCKAVNPAGEDKASAFLDVIVPPKVQVNVNKTEIASPKDVYVNCTVSGEPRPTVSWWKIGKDKPYVEDTQPDDSRITIKAENGPQYPGEIPSTISRLRIINTRHSDNGVYRCQGNNQAVELLRDDELRQIWPPYRIENELIVFSTPVIDRRNPWLYWSWIDHTVNLTCFAEGEPKAGITWWLNGIQVVYNIYFQLFGTNQLSFLQVTTKNPADFGTYQCVAYNSQGEDTMDIELKEGIAPRRPPTVKISLVTPT